MNGNIYTSAPGDIVESGARIIARKTVNETIDMAQWRTATVARISSIQSAIAATNNMAQVMEATIQRMSNSMQTESPVVTAVRSITDRIQATASSVLTSNSQTAAAVSNFQASASTSEDLLDTMQPVIESRMSTLEDHMMYSLDLARNTTEIVLSRTSGELQASSSRQLNSIQASLSSTMAPMAGLATAMGNTHYLHPEIPVYRWHMYHVYSNNGVGWFDGNNPRFFGGRHPSQWGDGNTNVWDMHRDIRYMARLFTRRGVGTQYGATVCSETWYLYSSTDTKYCIALFRIKNVGTSTVGWRVNWHGTGWSGWGNYQTITMNGSQRWGSSCTWWCHRSYTFNIPANSNRNRVSTVIFANGMCHPNHYADNHHIETTFLGFDGLALPNNLQYVDDMDTASGNWR